MIEMKVGEKFYYKGTLLEVVDVEWENGCVNCYFAGKQEECLNVRLTYGDCDNGKERIVIYKETSSTRIIYVSRDGDDLGYGTEETPYRTLHKAMTEALKGNAVVRIIQPYDFKIEEVI